MECIVIIDDSLYAIVWLGIIILNLFEWWLQCGCVLGMGGGGGVYTEFYQPVEKEKSAEIEGTSCHGNAGMCISLLDQDVDGV